MMDTERIKEALLSLGFKLSDRGSYWQTNAVFRNGNNSTAIQIYKDKGIWKDYVEDTPWSPFSRLIEITLGTNDKNEIAKYTGESKDDFYENKKESAPKLDIEETYDESMLDRLLPHYKYYNNKDISTTNLKALKGGLASSGQLNKRFIFPIYNENGQIHGFSGRDMVNSGSDNRPKWKHIGRKKNWVYPLYTDSRTLKSIEEKESVIIVESIGDLLSLRENGHYNSLVSFGLDISSKLATSLVSMTLKNIIIAFNNDEESKENRGAEACFKNFLKLLGIFSPSRIKICLPLKNDFGDMNKEEFSKWEAKLENCINSDQLPKIKDACEKLRDSRKIKASLIKKIKLIK